MRVLRWGMIGGGEGAFIGAVHRMAARLDGRYQLLAGVFSSDPEKCQRSAAALGVDVARAYPTVEAMIAAEAQRPDGVEVVSVVTPNHMHYPQSAAFLEAGIDVICDKPLTTNLADADKLVTLATDKKRLAGRHVQLHRLPDDPPRQAAHRRWLDRHAAGRAGGIPAGLARHRLEKTGQKQATWRTDPKQAGAGALGDIGSHAFQLVEFVTGEKVAEVAADVAAIVPGRTIDDNVNVLLRFANGARGSLWASQVAIGHLNSHRLRVYGENGSVQWFQERPEELLVVEAGSSPRCHPPRRSGNSDQLRGTSRRTSRGLHRSLLAAVHRFRGTRDRAAREAFAQGGVAVRAGRRHRRARHGLHRGGAEVGQGQQRLDHDLMKRD